MAFYGSLGYVFSKNLLILLLRTIEFERAGQTLSIRMALKLLYLGLRRPAEPHIRDQY